MRGRTKLRAGLVVCALMATSLVGVGPSQAVVLGDFTGFSNTQFPTVNFAVLSPNTVGFSGVLESVFNRGGSVPDPTSPSGRSPGFDSGQYTYLYQLANKTSATISSFTIPTTATTWGTYAGGNFRLDFLNNGTVVNAQGNNLQGAGSLGIAGRTVSGNDLVAVAASGVKSPNGIEWRFQSGGGGIAPGSTSPLFGYQSPNGPVSGGGVITGFFPSGASLGSLGSVQGISVAPEPGTVLLLGSGLVGLVSLRRKKQIQKTEAN